jgi:hypothetical protein
MGRNVIIIIVVVVAIMALICCCCVALGLIGLLVPMQWNLEELGRHGVSQPMTQPMPAILASAMLM